MFIGCGLFITHHTSTSPRTIVKKQIDDFVKYPPRQKAESDSVMAQLRPAMEAEKAKEAKEVQKEKRAT
jgi:hypothetical protein